jgi:hypothetical protein
MVYAAMLPKFCAKSQGQPLPGVRSAAMIPSSCVISFSALTGPSHLMGGAGAPDRAARVAVFAPETKARNSHKGYYGTFLIQSGWRQFFRSAKNLLRSLGSSGRGRAAVQTQ